MAKKLNFDPYEKCTQAIVFCRVSSKRQKDEGVSLDVQEKTITQYCLDKSFKILDTISIDESSTQGNRKNFMKCLSWLKHIKARLLLL